MYNRGVDHRDIFTCETDRRFFVQLLGGVAEEYKWRVFAYTEMTNHYHALFQTDESTLSRGMQELDGGLGAAFNKRHGRSGALFESRFKAHIVETESYLLELSRYIVLNPVRAGMVAAPGDWPWSSYRATAALAPEPAWLHSAMILDRFDEWDRIHSSLLYREFVAAGVGLTRRPWEDLRAGLYLGSESFVASMEELKADDRRTRRPVERIDRALDCDTLAALVEKQFGTALRQRHRPDDMTRPAFALLARTEAIASFSLIGTRLDLTYEGARTLLARADRMQKSNFEFARHVELLRRTISDLKAGR